MGPISPKFYHGLLIHQSTFKKGLYQNILRWWRVSKFTWKLFFSCIEWLIQIKFSFYSLSTLSSVTSWRCRLPRHCAQAQSTVQCRTSGELMATCEKCDRPGNRTRVSHYSWLVARHVNHYTKLGGLMNDKNFLFRTILLSFLLVMCFARKDVTLTKLEEWDAA